VGVRPNPELQGERVPGELEAGLSLRGGDGWEGRVALAAWVGDVRGMIVWAPDHRFVWSPTNVDVLRRGLEASGELGLPLGSGRLALSGQWTHARTIYDRPGAPAQVAYRPRNLGALRASWDGLRWEARLEARYTGVRYPFPSHVNPLAAFWTADLGVSRDVRLGGWRLSPSLDVDRILDNPDALLFGFPEPGRTLVLTVTVSRGPVP
jgi:outer membrane cobalamin receptor